MPHPLEDEYGLTAHEILDAIQSRFRLKVALEGAVAEVHLRKQLRGLKDQGIIETFNDYDANGFPDFTITVPGVERGLRIEVKNVRDDDYRQRARTLAYRVEVQKTRAAKADPSTRYYDVGYFDILAVCLGKKTGRWSDFAFAISSDLARHRDFSGKLAVMHRVPLPGTSEAGVWYTTLEQLLQSLRGGHGV